MAMDDKQRTFANKRTTSTRIQQNAKMMNVVEKKILCKSSDAWTMKDHGLGL